MHDTTVASEALRLPDGRAASPTVAHGPRSERWFNVVRIVLGLLLLTAAGLKLAGTNVTPVSQVGWFAQPWVQMLTAEWEIALGLWLLTGLRRIAAWLAALSTFLTFAGISFYLGWIGVSSCGCFGAIKASPWTAFSLDLVAVIGLICSRPKALRRSWTHELNQGLILGTEAGMVVVVISLVFTVAYGSPAKALHTLRGDLISVDSVVDVGAGKLGEEHAVTLWVTNYADHYVKIIGGTSDCSCIATDDLPLAVPPSGTSPVTVRVRYKGTPGYMARRFSLRTDDENQPVIGVNLTGQVVEEK